MLVTGFYTLAELLRQQARPPFDVGRARGWEVRVIMGPGETNICPEVELWPNRLVLHLTNDVLDETVRRVTAMLNTTLDDKQLALVRQSAFPRPVLDPGATAGVAESEPIATIQPGERLFLESRYLDPNTGDSFMLENPIGTPPEVLCLRPIGDLLMANAPEGMWEQMENAVRRVVRGLLL